MNKLFWALSFIITLFSCSPKYDVVRREANKTPSPPGTIWLKDNIFMDETEITNIAWREFVAWNKKMCGINSLAFTLSKSDTLVWSKLLTFSEPYVAYYHKHPAYYYYPMVGITKQQAESYCKWRTFVVNQKIFIDENKLKDYDIDTLVNFPIKYIYRLPTKAEWEYAASGGLDKENYPYGFEDLKFKYKKYQLNKINYNDTTHNKFITPKLWLYNGFLTQENYYGDSNKFGFYNMPGNVAELVAEDRIAKGGSYRHYPDSCKINIDIPYNEPEAWLGFRCVSEEVENNLIEANELLEFDYSPEKYNSGLNSILNDSLYSLKYGKFKIKPAENYFGVNSDPFIFYKDVREIILLDSSENIISFGTIFYPASKSKNIITDESNSGKFTMTMQQCLKKCEIGDIIILHDIRVKNKYNIITLPPVYIMLKE